MVNNILTNFNYKIDYTKSRNHILINPKDWEQDASKLIHGYSIYGDVAMNYLTKVLKTNIDNSMFGEPVNEGDLVLLTKAASKISYLKPFEIIKGFDKAKLSNVHIMQVIGKFTDNKMTLENFVPLFDKVVMEKVPVEISKLIYAGENETTSVGKVIKIGTGGFTSKWEHREMEVKEGDYVLLRDNITTTIYLNNIEYICTEDSMIVGKFQDSSLDMSTLQMFHKGVMLEEKQEEKVLGSNVLFNPLYDLDVEDISDVYQRDRFKVINKSNNIEEVNINDIIVISRDCTNYVVFKGKTYYIINGLRDVEATIEQ